MQTQLHNFGLLRRPLLPEETVFDFHQKVENNVDLFKEELLRIFSDPLLQDSIYLASPPLYDSLLSELAGSDSKAPMKMYLSLYKYLIRMSSRCTPFGLFAGCTMFELRSHTAVRINDKKIKAATRLDSWVAWQLCCYWQNQPELSWQLLYFPNSSLKRAPGCFQYMERIYDGSGNFTWTELEYSEPLNQLIQCAAKGCRIDALLQVLISMKIESEQGLSYIKKLIDSQVLVSELEAFCIHDDFFGWAAQKLGSLQNAQVHLQHLKAVGKVLDSKVELARKAQIINELLLTKYQIRLGNHCPLQLDMFFPSDAITLNKTMIGQIVLEFDRLSVLAEQKENPSLSTFTAQLYRRYQHQQIPLALALDPDSGIEYGHHAASHHQQTFQADLAAADFQRANHGLSHLNQFKLDLYTSALTEGKMVLQIGDEDLARIEQSSKAKQKKSSEGAYLFGSLFSKSVAAYEQGEFMFLHHASGGPSAFNLMTRFCHGDHVLNGMVSQGISAEQLYHPDVIFAEISHLPQIKAANILSRPMLRKHEICYLSRRFFSENHTQLLVEDLLISVSEQQELILFSKSLNKRIIPRLTNAHNYSQGLPIYQFLCDLSRMQSDLHVNWDWDFLSNQPFLPRIQYKHIILSPAVWNITLPSDKREAGQRMPLATRWAELSESLSLPPQFFLSWADTQLLIDSASDFALGIVFDSLDRYGLIRIVEHLGQTTTGILSSSGRCFTNQIIIPMLHVAQQSVKQNVELNTFQHQRSFLPGSEWLSVKIYCGALSAERILTTLIYPLIKKLLLENAIDCWFYLRYHDRDHHLRLRMRCKGGEAGIGRPLAMIRASLSNELYFGAVSSVCVDTYQRELERYSGVSYQIVESIFCFDSHAVLELICSGLAQNRLSVALAGIYQMLEDFDMSLPEKEQFCHNMALSLAKRMDADLHELNHQFRLERPLIEQTLLKLAGGRASVIGSIFNDRSKTIRSSVQGLGYGQRKQALAASFIHMFINRLFVSNHMQQELLVYHFLYKYTAGQRARKKRHNKK